MVRALRIANIVMLIVFAVLLIWFFSDSITGHMTYSLDSSAPRCLFVSADGESHEIENLDICCFEIQKMLTYEKVDGDLDYIYYNLKEGNKYYINSKTFGYCLKEGYDIEKA